jgi:polyribonucleotide 5'-hydroxyl-kinase
LSIIRSPSIGSTTVCHFTRSFTAVTDLLKAAGYASAFDPGADDDDEDEYEPKPLSTGLYDKIIPSLMLQNSIIAVTDADAHDSQNIRDSSVMWYVYVADVDESKQRLKVVNPVSGRLPPNALVWGSWPEGVADMVG